MSIQISTEHENLDIKKIDPVCPLFGKCGGCHYQNISYEDELYLKERYLQELFAKILGKEILSLFDPMVASPQPYHYRNGLDVKLARTKQFGILTGFSPEGRKQIVPAESCAIARREVSDFLPELKRQAEARLTPKYRAANLVVRTGDDGRVLWGGIGRHSLNLKEDDYLWTEIDGRRIFYSLDTFFQANLSILPSLMAKIRSLQILDRETTFFDLYGGVGLFGMCLWDQVKRVVLIEENIHALKVATYNVKYNQLSSFEIHAERVEDKLSDILDEDVSLRRVAVVDPPRQGLSESALELLIDPGAFNAVLYLSCRPESLIRDLPFFLAAGWRLKKIVPFDFFPRTKHLETLVLLESTADNRFEGRQDD